jgi:hypothetical protein
LDAYPYDELVNRILIGIKNIACVKGESAQMILSYRSFQRGTAFAVVMICLVFRTVAHAGTSPLDPGPHDATLGDVTLHYVIAGRGPLLIVPSPGWGPGSLYLQRGLAPLELHQELASVD